MTASRDDFVSLNVGGVTFLTSKRTIDKFPDSNLAKVIYDHINEQTDPTSIDRSSWAFGYVLDFLREGKDCLLPKLPQELDRLLVEAAYYGLPEFEAHLEQALDLWSQWLSIEVNPSDDRYFLVQDKLIRVTRSAWARSELLLKEFVPEKNSRRHGYTADRPMCIDRDPELFEKCFGENNPKDLLPWQTTSSHTYDAGPEEYWCPHMCRLALHPYIDKMEEEAKHFEMAELIADIEKCRELHADCSK